jgi:hypothetical protein
MWLKHIILVSEMMIPVPANLRTKLRAFEESKHKDHEGKAEDRAASEKAQTEHQVAREQGPPTD